MQNKILSDLFSMRDEKFAQFNAKLIPNISSTNVIGVRTPILKRYTKTLQETDKFISKLPHKYFEENQIHAFILSEIRDFDVCVMAIDSFLPYIDNWATCDQLIPKTFAKNTEKLIPWIKKWIHSKNTYAIRFAIGNLMRFFLGDRFNPEYAEMVINVHTDEYYINMMRAWYFSTGLAKNWNSFIHILENKCLDLWTHNKTIQKAIESYRITPEQKQYLVKLKR